MGVTSLCWSGLCYVSSAAFEYDTPKIVHIKNKKVGFVNRVVQLGIILYIIVWGIILQKGYQITGPVTGTVTTKLKGASYYDGNLGDYTEYCDEVHGDINRTFDVGDYVIPPQEPNSFFVLTNIWRTCNQTQGVCAESPTVHGSSCNMSDPTIPNPACGVDKVFEAGNGPTTGNCVLGANGTERCEIRGWCNVETENENITSRGAKIDASNFTVLVKNSIEFPDIQRGLRKRNIKETANKTFLQTCRHDSSTEDGLYCPIFTLHQIVDMIEKTNRIPKQDIHDISIKGGVIGLEIHWNCDHLERNLDHCHPRYVAKRYDDPKAKLSQGYNFRFVDYYYDDGVQKRILTKAYGILFKIEIHGTGGRFDFFTVVLKIGSMIALLSIASVVCDILVLYVLKSHSYYRDNKYLNVTDPQMDYDIIGHHDAKEMPVNTKIDSSSNLVYSNK